nr:hypothetical protein A4E73_00602 [Ipomoea trifida]
MRVSIRTPVSMVRCKLPLILAPLKGWEAPNSARQAISPGISTSASSISSRPKLAWDMSFTLYSRPEVLFSTVNAMGREIEYGQ